MQGDILKSLPDCPWVAVPVNIMMVITVIGGFPLWMEPVNEMVEVHWGPCTKGKYFISNPTYIVFRIVEIILISLVAWFVPQFSDILSVVGNFSDNIIFSTILMVVCTVVSVKTLIDHITGH